MENVTAMLEKRAGLIEQARGLVKLAEDEDRSLNAEERQSFDRITAEADAIKAEVDEAEQDMQRRAKLEADEANLKEARGRQVKQDDPNTNGPTKKVDVVELRSGYTGMARAIVCDGERGTADYNKEFRSFLLTGETRALQKDLDVAGGYLSAPEQFQATLIQELDNLIIMRTICNVLPPLTTAESLGAPSLDNDIVDPTWTAEIATGDDDTALTFGKRNLVPHPLAQRIKVSKTMLLRSAIGPDAIIRQRLAFKMAAVQENAFMNGSGSLQPLGVFTADDNGITTSQDVSTGNTSTEIRFDGLINAKMDMPAQYRSNLSAIFHRDAIKQTMKLKDGEGRYIWQASVIPKEPDTLLNVPVLETEYAPNTFTAGKYVGIFGDFSHYWIVDALTLTIQVLIEKYAETNQNGYISRSETDAMPVLAAAFRRVKLGA